MQLRFVASVMKFNRLAPRRTLWRADHDKASRGVFYYLAFRQANSTTTAPAAAAMIDVTSPPPIASSTAM